MNEIERQLQKLVSDTTIKENFLADYKRVLRTELPDLLPNNGAIFEIENILNNCYTLIRNNS